MWVDPVQNGDIVQGVDLHHPLTLDLREEGNQGLKIDRLREKEPEDAGIIVMAETGIEGEGRPVDCPRSGPGPVRPLLADLGLGPQVQVQQTLDLDLSMDQYRTRT